MEQIYEDGWTKIPRPDLSDIDPDEDMTIWKRRLCLASMGWITSLSMDKHYTNKEYFTSLSAQHNHWQGTLSEVSLGTGFLRSSISENLDMEEFNKRVKSLHKRAIHMWNTYKEFLPSWNCTTKEWDRDYFSKDHYEKYPENVVEPERGLVTEALPGWKEFGKMSSINETNDNWIIDICDIIRNQRFEIKWYESFNPYGCTFFNRVNDRKWQLDIHPVLLRVDGKRVTRDVLRILDKKVLNYDPISIDMEIRNLKNLVTYYNENTQLLPPGIIWAKPREKEADINDD